MRTASDAERLRTTYREAIARFTTGVTLITTRTENGPAGMTASAVTSLSLQPLQLIVCIGNGLATGDAISESGRFAVNVLGREHEYLARRFAMRRRDKFDGVALSADHDLPVLTASIAHFVCDVAHALPGGDHTILIGDVVACGFTPDAQPLVYFGSGFGGLCDDNTHAQLAFDWQLASAM
jgi:flavin reductase (DIM6/NTAB) family NADH-FMN oxidoreductase RutF